MDLSPIRLRLAAWNLVVLGLVLAVTVVTAALGERRATSRAVDESLRVAAARAAARFEQLHHEHRERGNHAEPDADDGEGEETGLVVIAMRPGDREPRVNRFVMPPGLPDQGALAAALRGEASFSERDSAGEPLRVHSAPVVHEGRILGAVQIARSLGESRRALTRSVLVLVSTGAGGLVLAAVGSVFLSGRAMRPIASALERQRRFIADASHELRTPVAVIRARAEVLARDEGASGEIGRLHRDAEEMAGLLEDLLDLARLDEPGGDLPLAPVALDEVAEEVAEQLGPVARERGVALTARCDQVWARSNLGRLRQVLRALADNAIKHTPKGGSVVLEARREGDRAKVSVRDDGEGIAAEHLPHVLGRFYRADPARGRGGVGLGLAIAAELVQRMHGEIGIESEVGRGTTVTVRLPLPTT